MEKKYDVIIIGGGILGAMAARELSRYQIRIAVFEKAADIGEGATKTNSGILAAGFHPRGGSLKGISCVGGNQMYHRICEELNVPVKFIGSLFVAFSRQGEEMIAEKYQKGKINGVPGMEIISGNKARMMQPGLSERITQALFAPTTGIIDPFQLVFRTAQNASENGVEFFFQEEVQFIDGRKGDFCIHTDKRSVKADYIINTAGENAAFIERFMRPADLIIKPRRGQFYVFDKQKDPFLKYVIYQAQDEDEKGCLITPTIEGNIIAGPTSENVRNYHCVETTRDGLDLVERVAKKIIPGIDMGTVITSFAGVRANIKNVAKEEKDFVIRQSVPGMISALGIKNPGLTSAPYLVQKMVALLYQDGLELEHRDDYCPYVSKTDKFLDCSAEEQKRLFSLDSSYGKLICRCENITEGDIKRILREPLPPATFNGLKKRLRAGMGRCQGAYCTPRIIEIMSRELQVEPEILLKGPDKSNLVKGRLK